MMLPTNTIIVPVALFLVFAVGMGGALASEDYPADIKAVMAKRPSSSSVASSRYLQDVVDAQQCGATSCCIDCVCCGPGTQWDGQKCIPGMTNAVSCDALPIVEVGGCLAEWVCLGQDCCGEGTQAVTDPTRPAEACYCVPEQETPTEPPTGTPTDSPTDAPTSFFPPGFDTCYVKGELECREIGSGLSCENIAKNTNEDESCLRDVRYSITFCNGWLDVLEVTLSISKDGVPVESGEMPSPGIFPPYDCASPTFYASTVDVCSGGQYDVVATYAANGFWGGDEIRRSFCKNTSQIQFTL